MPHALRLTPLIAPLVGGLAVLAWRIQETRTPVTANKILIPPLGMSTVFFILAFGMISRWLATMYLRYRAMTTAPATEAGLQSQKAAA